LTFTFFVHYLCQNIFTNIIHSLFKLTKSCKNFSVLRSPFSVLLILFFSFEFVKAQNLIQNGSFENFTFPSCGRNIKGNSSPDPSDIPVTGWTALPPCNLVNNTPNLSKNGCFGVSTPFGSNFMNLNFNASSLNLPSSDERVRCTFSTLESGFYQFSLSVFFDRDRIGNSFNEQFQPSTLRMTLINPQVDDCSGRIIGEVNLADINAEWVRFNFCVPINQSRGDFFSQIQFRLVDLQGAGTQREGYVHFDDVSLQKIPQAVEDFDVNFITENDPWGWGLGKMSTMLFTPRGVRSPLLSNYNWTAQFSNDHGTTWNSVWGAWPSWDGSLTMLGGMGKHYRAILSAQSAVCPNAAICPTTSTIYVNHQVSGYTDEGFSSPSDQDFNIEYTRDISGPRMTAQPVVFTGLTDEWREGIVLSWPTDWAISNPEWGDNNGILPFSNTFSNYNPYYRTIGHRTSKGNSPTHGDKITFLESHNSGCSWFDYLAKPRDLKPQFSQSEISKIQESEISNKLNSEMNKPKISKITGLQIFPNPTYGHARVVYESASVSKIAIYDITGKLLIEKKVNAQGNVEEMIDCTEFNNGIYLVKVSNANKVLTKKLVIRK
jgi:hypothetical protein